jgi:hypothetical protein
MRNYVFTRLESNSAFPQSRNSAILFWRRGWDSNPRNGFPFTAFPVLPVQPLLHLSGIAKLRNCEIAKSNREQLAVRFPKFRNFAILFWRRGWDSNPRWPLSHSGFRDRCTNPLCDLSASSKDVTLLKPSFLRLHSLSVVDSEKTLASARGILALTRLR